MLIMNKSLHQVILKSLLGAILTIGMIACTPENPAETEQFMATPTVTKEIRESTPTQIFTSTPNTAKVFLMTDADADPSIIAQVQQQLTSLAAETGFIFEVVGDLTVETLTSDVKIVVGVGPNPDLVDIALGHPQTTFLFIDHMEIEPTSNINQIGDQFQDIQDKAFMAGYLAALVSTDYKVAALVPSDIESKDLILDSFVTGARFFCGICQPKYPPYNTFPKWETISSAEAQQGFQATVDTLINQGVEILYVSGDLVTATLLDYLAESDIQVVGDSQPGQIRENWLGTVSIDLEEALVELCETIVA